MMSDDLQAFRERAARAVAKVARGSAVDNADRYIRMADAVIAEFAKPTDGMIDAAYEAVRFDEAWAHQLAARLRQSREGHGPTHAGQAHPRIIPDITARPRSARPTCSAGIIPRQ